MSTFTRTTTPTFWGNPLQVFVTYNQARRAAKAAGVTALLFASLGGWALFRLLFAGTAPRPDRITIIMLVPGTLLTLTMALLGWRIWVRPGPWKTFAILAFVTFDIVRVFFGFSGFTFLFATSLVILGLALNVSVISFRGALAMKGLEVQADLDVF